MARRSLKPQLNQIRTWVRQGRTDAWIAHQLESSPKEIGAFKREHDLAPGDSADADVDHGPRIEEEPDLRAEDEALVAAALEAQADDDDADDADDGPDSDGEDADDDSAGGEDDGQRKRRRRGRRGGKGRASRSGGAGGGGRRSGKALEGTFDHGEEGYGLWLDPAVQENAVYAEHWAGHRPVSVTIEANRIIIRRAGENGASED